MDKVSFVILTWNSEKVILPCLESISSIHEQTVEVILIDNGSADGTVQDIVHLNDDDFLKSSCTKVIIFLSVFDVHVNRSPIAGEIKLQKYVCGRFRPAYKDSVGFENERHLLGIENEKLRVTVTQIAGILARRIVSWVTLDDKLEKGELYGLIRFGSCTEIVVPDNVEVLVTKGEKVRGGETIIGKIRSLDR